MKDARPGCSAAHGPVTVIAHFDEHRLVVGRSTGQVTLVDRRHGGILLGWFQPGGVVDVDVVGNRVASIDGLDGIAVVDVARGPDDTFIQVREQRLQVGSGARGVAMHADGRHLEVAGLKPLAGSTTELRVSSPGNAAPTWSVVVLHQISS